MTTTSKSSLLLVFLFINTNYQQTTSLSRPIQENESPNRLLSRTQCNDRRAFLRLQTAGAVVTASVSLADLVLVASVRPQPCNAEDVIGTKPDRSNAAVSIRAKWEGTSLRQQTIEEALRGDNEDDDACSWQMARWPDPILRVPTTPVPSQYLSLNTQTESARVSSSTLYKLCMKLQNTCKKAGAVGLAAQQCGINAAIIWLDNNTQRGIHLCNPRFVERSPEIEMLVWEEECLVLPPEVRVTVLRDKNVVIEAEDEFGRTRRVKLHGELARTAQHEWDHMRGILILDHLGLDEIMGYDEEYDYGMMKVEQDFHEDRQIIAFSRPLELTATATAYDKDTNAGTTSWFVPSASAAEHDNSKCDDECRRRLSERRALMQQSRTTRSRQEVLDLSRQRASLYNTTSRAVSCVSELPCL